MFDILNGINESINISKPAELLQTTPELGASFTIRFPVKSEESLNVRIFIFAESSVSVLSKLMLPLQKCFRYFSSFTCGHFI